MTGAAASRAIFTSMLCELGPTHSLEGGLFYMHEWWITGRFLGERGGLFHSCLPGIRGHFIG